MPAAAVAVPVAAAEEEDEVRPARFVALPPPLGRVPPALPPLLMLLLLSLRPKRLEPTVPMTLLA